MSSHSLSPSGGPAAGTGRTDIRPKGSPGGGSYDLSVTGMSCASCVGRVERALAAVPGVTSASVNLATEMARVRAADATSVADLLAAVKKAGYEADVMPDRDMLREERAARQDAERQSLLRDLRLAVALTLPVFVLEMGAHLWPGMAAAVSALLSEQGSWLLQFALTTAVLLFPGRRFFTSGLPALARRAPDMNSLVAVGAGAAYAYSLVATFIPGALPVDAVHVYYEAAAVIVTLILLGRFLEAGAKGRTSDAIKHLMQLQPDTARVQRNGEIVEVPASQIRPGDVLLLRPGDRIPVDGEIVQGSGYVDESMITGEPVPAARNVGDTLVAGTVNQNGRIMLQACQTGENTILAQIIRTVEQAQASKLPIQAWVDRITLWFVPAIMALAVITFVAWLLFAPSPALAHAVVSAVAVLIIACPCAMGLATPTSIMVGTGRAAQLGVLIRRGEALESLQQAKVVVFDKTGTMTEGHPVLTDMVPAQGQAGDTVLALVASAQTGSEHPIASAIVQAARDRGISLAMLDEFEALPGLGIRAAVRPEHPAGEEGTLAKKEGSSLRVDAGSSRLMDTLGVDVSAFLPQARRLAEEGKTPIYAAINGKAAAMLAVADPVKTGTEAAIRALHAFGLKIVMMTGDNQGTAQAVARQLNIDEVLAEILPADKAEQVKTLQSRYGKVVFVGDGINDAPALAQADAGIAIGTGTDIAMDAADVVLMSGDLRGVITAMAISRATLRNIRQNLFWAFAYNTALIPVAAGVLYPWANITLSPLLAAAAMAMSSIFVVGNALRLRRYAPPG
ncbi:copper-translocating P-type ATPase [Allopusillimonas soli]|uniref:P-type Cu(+) transporter n=1 Tax=Allopusillimonas soli TaxID=659016 RepID=A0A853FDY4_9BURK|nr:heavy metal translocating P-type ATPase [Allopusillimonas soli]NYT36721.1 copper-translocating P-type ATPase [Allopusillimonas soli]TEA75197.1 copper-translocating P-type ATPase [Allopusillimonas soli]